MKLKESKHNKARKCIEQKINCNMFEMMTMPPYQMERATVYNWASNFFRKYSAFSDFAFRRWPITLRTRNNYTIVNIIWKKIIGKMKIGNHSQRSRRKIKWWKWLRIHLLTISCMCRRFSFICCKLLFHFSWINLFSQHVSIFAAFTLPLLWVCNKKLKYIKCLRAFKSRFGCLFGTPQVLCRL